MKEFKFPAILFVIPFSLMLTSCEVFEGVFKLGVWSGVIIVVLIIILAGWLFTKFRK